MIMNLVVGVLVMTVCLAVQMMLLVYAFRYYRSHEQDINSPSMWSSILVLSAVMVILVLGNMGQIGLWALIFQAFGEFEVFADAFYHSAVNFATLGYGDIVMSEERRLLGALEAVNGVLMIGVSTASLMVVLSDAMKKTFAARRH
jgi:voltage-gated potassium channel Kch